MYTDRAYLGRMHEDIFDDSKPLVITAVGYYRPEKTYRIFTKRRLGRRDYQLLYIAKGKAHFDFNGERVVISEGNMVIFRPHQPQMYDLYLKDKPETYWIHFTGYDAGYILDHFNMPKDDKVFYAGLSPDYINLFREMIRELKLKRYNYEEMLSLQFKSLLIVIERYLQAGNNKNEIFLNEIERAIHYFNNNFEKQITIAEYAQNRFMKADGFIKDFKKVTGQTPMQYIVSLRIEKAVELLLSTKLNISQVAAAVGYPNALYFSRLFSKHTGMSPKQYRAKK